MGNKDITSKFCELLGKEQVFIEEPMNKHTTFRVGGPAQYYVCPKTKEQVAGVLQICKQYELAYYIIGNGSNLLVSDKGYRGVIIQLYKNFHYIKVEHTKVIASAGSLLSQVAGIALENSLKGFEFAAGIPGTVGGAIVMNAGAYGGEMKDIVEQVTVLEQQGTIKTLSKEELKYGYRYSAIPENHYIVLEVIFSLELGEPEEIKAYMENLREQRISKQPLNVPSAGSTFKRPQGAFAGALIQECGLRGYRVGGAMVSEKHCGFVVNDKNATAKEVLTLIKEVKAKVKSETGFELEPEVKMIGEFD